MMRTRWLLVICVVAIAAPFAQQRSIDDFFRTISDDWVRMNPNLAVSTRYFSGDEQDRLEQQISSVHREGPRRAATADYIKRGLGTRPITTARGMSTRSACRPTCCAITCSRTSTGTLRRFPASRWISSTAPTSGLLRRTPSRIRCAAAKDASNYVARLGQVGPRMPRRSSIAAASRGERI